MVPERSHMRYWWICVPCDTIRGHGAWYQGRYDVDLQDLPWVWESALLALP